MSDKLKAINPLRLRPDQLSDDEKSSIREAVRELHPNAGIEQLRELSQSYGWSLKEAYALVLNWRQNLTLLEELQNIMQS